MNLSHSLSLFLALTLFTCDSVLAELSVSKYNNRYIMKQKKLVKLKAIPKRRTWTKQMKSGPGWPLNTSSTKTPKGTNRHTTSNEGSTTSTKRPTNSTRLLKKSTKSRDKLLTLKVIPKRRTKQTKSEWALNRSTKTPTSTKGPTTSTK